MLTLEQLKIIKEIPDESDISLKLLADFYEKYIFKKFNNVNY